MDVGWSKVRKREEVRLMLLPLLLMLLLLLLLLLVVVAVLRHCGRDSRRNGENEPKLQLKVQAHRKMEKTNRMCVRVCDLTCEQPQRTKAVSRLRHVLLHAREMMASEQQQQQQQEEQRNKRHRRHQLGPRQQQQQQPLRPRQWRSV